MAITVGSVGVTIYPNTTNFWNQFKAQTKAGAESAADDLGRTLADKIPSKLSDAVIRGLNSSAPKAEGKKAGSDYADEFSRTVGTRIEAALRALPTRIQVDADTVPAITEIEALKYDLQALKTKLSVGYIDDASAAAQIDVLHAKFLALSQDSPDIRIRTNAAAVAAQLGALDAQINTLDDTVVDLNEDLGDGGTGGGSGDGGTSGRLKTIATVIAYLGPALIPIGGAALGALGGLAVGAGVAALAFLGLKNDVDAASTELVQGSLNDLQGSLKDLEGVSARAIAPGLAAGMKGLADSAPELTGTVHALSQDFGIIASNAGPGVASIFLALSPLTIQLADATAKWSGSLTDIGNSAGFKSFVAYITAQLPKVGDELAALGTAVGHIVLAFQPWGDIMTTAITVFSNAISVIPIPVLQVLATIFELYLTQKGVGLVLGLIGDGLLAIADSSLVAAAGEDVLIGTNLALEASFGPIGLAAAAVSVILVGAIALFGHHTSSVNDEKAAIQGLTSAYKEDNDTIGTNTKLKIQQNLVADGGVESAKRLGLSFDTVTQAAEGNAVAMVIVTDAIKKAQDARDKATDSVNVSGSALLDGAAADSLSKSLDIQTTSVAAVAEQQKALSLIENNQLLVTKSLSDVYGDLGLSLGISADAVKTYAGDLGLSDDASSRTSATVTALAQSYATANTSQEALLDATIAYTQSSGKASDQAALLGATLVAGQGPALSIGQAYSAAAKANADFTASFTGTDKASVDNRTELGKLADSLHGVNLATADVSTLEQIYSNTVSPQVTSALGDIQSAADKVAEQTYQQELATKGTAAATADATTVFNDYTHNALQQNLEKLGLTTQQADDLADSYFNMPKLATTDVIANGLESVNQTLQTFALTLANINGKHYSSFVQLSILTTNSTDSAATARAGEQASQGESANGNIYGPSTAHYADGAHVAAIFQPKVRVFAEPETGGEAYIPMGLAKRSRSTSILSTVASEFGYSLTPNAGSSGQYATSGSIASASTDSGLLDEIRTLRGTVSSLGDRFDKAIANQSDTLRLASQAGSRVVSR